MQFFSVNYTRVLLILDYTVEDVTSLCVYVVGIHFWTLR